MRRSAFTLVELLTVVAILAILYAILMPVVIQVKGYAQQYVAGQSMMRFSTATSMYLVDNDDTFQLGYYRTDNGSRQNWFGILDEKGEVIEETSLLGPYIKGKIQADSAFNGKPWQGDKTGFGFNWGYLGSDAYLQNPWTNWQQCVNPARFSELGHPSDTVEFATSVFYFAPWMKGGDGLTYRYSFIDPPKTWYGNPTVDFRHMGAKHVDKKKHEVTSTGCALIVFSDGHLKSMRQKQVKNRMFRRGEGWETDKEDKDES